jgi:hypothetical protein
MKVSELKHKLEHANDDDNVMVAIKLPFSTVGAIPMTSVKYAFTGFDWEKGNFVITPEENLTPADRDFESQMKEMQEKLGWVKYENRNLKSEIKKLKTILGDKK